MNRLLPLLGIALASGSCLAQAQEPPAVDKIWFEKLGGGIEQVTGPFTRQLLPAPEAIYEYKGGTYRSVLSRIVLKVPRIGDETVVSVREAVTLSRRDGSPATTHVIFQPGGGEAVVDPSGPISAVVVTRLRSDRPQDAAEILDGLDGGAQGRRLLEVRGVSYSKVLTRVGLSLQRLVPNRAQVDRFPYQLEQLPDDTVKTYGATQFVVVGLRSFVEFSQIFPCGPRSPDACRTAAQESLQRMVGGVVAFLSLPADPPAPRPAN